ncbi:hypothetical protein M2G93_19055 [Vibrio vulnificus]|uniref:hypothetical protein n=1 Tax=Vibrio vulnificus TaxID=672 RepID=UPI0021DAED33|nr:hypothetical protein [Vibrio vulnificus]EHD1697972.1 hypothetical protein [Vibrio vulnificus]EKZ9225771.1 hypothetical protein [Vibrio vulnificus]ELC9582617.1 hypothetical protein [Vibrio vulnificus]MCU8150222.1 hypothetical protein [Vibrio vulnificus]
MLNKDRKFGVEAVKHTQSITDFITPDQKLPTALRCIGITEKTPNHVTYLLLEQINSVAILNGDSELETACQAKMHEIKQGNLNQG